MDEQTIEWTADDVKPCAKCGVPVVLCVCGGENELARCPFGQCVGTLSARPTWLTELIAAGKQLIAANEFGTPDEYCKAEVALTRAALAIPQEGK